MKCLKSRITAAIAGMIYRIQGIGRVRRLYAQLDPMKDIVGQLKKDRDSSLKKIAGVEKELSALIQKIKVRFVQCAL